MQYHTKEFAQFLSMCYLPMAQVKKSTLLNMRLEGGESFLKWSVESFSLDIKELNLPMNSLSSTIWCSNLIVPKLPLQMQFDS